ncbi:hypothetical protein, partial [Pseudomonas aeruginosa]
MSGSHITSSFSAHLCVYFGPILLKTSLQVKPLFNCPEKSLNRFGFKPYELLKRVESNLIEGLLLADSGLYAAATDQTNTHCANLVMARLTPTPADIVKQGVDGLDVLQEFGWLR